MYICEKCSKKCCINCRIIIKKKSATDSDKCQILCKNCSKNEDNNKKLNNRTNSTTISNNSNNNQIDSPSMALLVTKKEIVNALISKAQNQSVCTTTTTVTNTETTSAAAAAHASHNKANKLNKVSNCDEYYPNAENIPYIHHYHHRRKVEANDIVPEEKLQKISNSNDENDENNKSDLISNNIRRNVSLSIASIPSNNNNNIDDEQSFIIYAEKEIANLERTIQLKNIENQQVQTLGNLSSNDAKTLTSKIMIKEIKDNQLMNSIETDSDNELNEEHEEIVFNQNGKISENLSFGGMKRIAPASKFSDEFKQMTEKRTKEKVSLFLTLHQFILFFISI